MTLANLSWRRWLNSLTQLVREDRCPPNRKRLRRPRRRLVLEHLEDRIAPTASLVKDIGVAMGNPHPAGVTAVGSTLYFAANDGASSYVDSSTGSSVSEFSGRWK
jgi:hypothetical protein